MLKYIEIENFIKHNKIKTAITNKKLVLTGTFKAFSRAELKSICEKNGAKVLDSSVNECRFASGWSIPWFKGQEG